MQAARRDYSMIWITRRSDGSTRYTWSPEYTYRYFANLGPQALGTVRSSTSVWQRCTDRKSFFDGHRCNTLLHHIIPDNGALLRLDNDRFGGTNADSLRKRLRPGENSYCTRRH
jgi:hypothetical protein